MTTIKKFNNINKKQFCKRLECLNKWRSSEVRSTCLEWRGGFISKGKGSSRYHESIKKSSTGFFWAHPYDVDSFQVQLASSHRFWQLLGHGLITEGIPQEPQVHASRLARKCLGESCSPATLLQMGKPEILFENQIAYVTYFQLV